MYRQGLPMPNKANNHVRAGWLQASIMDPGSYVNKTDQQLLNDKRRMERRSAEVKEEEEKKRQERSKRIAEIKANREKRERLEREKAKRTKNGKKMGRPPGSKNKVKRRPMKRRKSAMKKTRICETEGCGRSYEAKGLCKKHYYRSRKGLSQENPGRSFGPKVEAKPQSEDPQVKAVICNGCFNPFKPNRMQIKKSSHLCRACAEGIQK